MGPSLEWSRAAQLLYVSDRSMSCERISAERVAISAGEFWFSVMEFTTGCDETDWTGSIWSGVYEQHKNSSDLLLQRGGYQTFLLQAPCTILSCNKFIPPLQDVWLKRRTVNKDQGSHYLLILKFKDYSRTSKDPQISFSRTNSRRKFTAWAEEPQYLMFIYVTMVQ